MYMTYSEMMKHLFPASELSFRMFNTYRQNRIDGVYN